MRGILYTITYGFVNILRSRFTVGDFYTRIIVHRIDAISVTFELRNSDDPHDIHIHTLIVDCITGKTVVVYK